MSANPDPNATPTAAASSTALIVAQPPQMTYKSQISHGTFKFFITNVGGGFSGLRADFPKFKRSVMVFARGIGVEDHLTGNFDKTKTLMDEGEWNMVDRLFMSQLILSLNQLATQDSLDHCKTVRQVWTYLLKVNEHKNVHEANQIVQSLLEFKIHITDDITVKVFELQKLYSDWMRAACAPAEPETFISYLYRATWSSIRRDISSEQLHRSHQVQNKMLDTHGELIVPHTIEEMISFVIDLVTKEQADAQADSGALSHAVAFNATTSPTKSSSEKSVKCPICPMPIATQHDINNCPYLAGAIAFASRDQERTTTNSKQRRRERRSDSDEETQEQ